MHQIISDAAMIREMSSDELEEYYTYWLAQCDSLITPSIMQMWDDIQLVNKQYLQLTNKKLFKDEKNTIRVHNAAIKNKGI